MSSKGCAASNSCSDIRKVQFASLGTPPLNAEVNTSKELEEATGSSLIVKETLTPAVSSSSSLSSSHGCGWYFALRSYYVKKSTTNFNEHREPPQPVSPRFLLQATSNSEVVAGINARDMETTAAISSEDVAGTLDERVPELPCCGAEDLYPGESEVMAARGEAEPEQIIQPAGYKHRHEREEQVAGVAGMKEKAAAKDSQESSGYYSSFYHSSRGCSDVDHTDHTSISASITTAPQQMPQLQSGVQAQENDCATDIVDDRPSLYRCHNSENDDRSECAVVQNQSQILDAASIQLDLLSVGAISNDHFHEDLHNEDYVKVKEEPEKTKEGWVKRAAASIVSLVSCCVSRTKKANNNTAAGN